MALLVQLKQVERSLWWPSRQLKNQSLWLLVKVFQQKMVTYYPKSTGIFDQYEDIVAIGIAHLDQLMSELIVRHMVMLDTPNGDGQDLIFLVQ